MGTGNDGADCARLADALDLLVKPSRITFAPAVRLNIPAREKGLFLAFNILSVGLDAFVTHMTNKMKGKLPGDSYKLWVDIAALFYDRLYKVDYFDVRGLDEQNREIRAFREKFLLLAMGASGFRTYGSQKKILPNEHNVCCIKQTSLPGKLALKTLVAQGRHTDHPDSVIFSAHRLEISGNCPVLAQMDGETVLLQPVDFPVSIELTAPVIPLLKQIAIP
jgi:diacylglycerol kinase family enzyme